MKLRMILLLFISGLFYTPCRGAGTNLLLRSYYVNPSFVDVVNDPVETAVGGEFVGMAAHREPRTTDELVLEFFTKAGVEFPEGAGIHYNQTAKRLEIKNTPENIAIFERIVVTGPDILLEQTELTVSTYRTLHSPGSQPPLVANAADILSSTHGVFTLVDSIKTVSRSSVNVMVKTTTSRTDDAQIEEDPDKEPKDEGEDTAQRGSDLSYTAMIGPDGNIVDVIIVWSGSSESPMASNTVVRHEITTSCLMEANQSLILLTSSQDGFTDYVLAQLRLVDLVGNPILTPLNNETNH